MQEIWKDIKNFEGLYQISNLGNIKSLHYRNSNNEKIMSPKLIGRGYLSIGLRNKSKKKNFLIHRLVANAFIPNPDNLQQVNHKDENKLNNCVDNLEWCNNSYNNTYGARKDHWKGKNNPQYKDGRWCKEQ